MNKLLEIREYESITFNENFENDPQYSYLEKDTFAELENFMLSFGENDDSFALDFLKISSKRNIGKLIQAKNFVGVIQMKNGYQIQILPKIDISSKEETKKIFIKMLRSMKDFPNKVFSDANLKVDRMNLYELFINMYVQEVRILVKKGIRSSYLPIEENSGFFKGKLMANEHIRSNTIHKERFYINYDEFLVNRPENQLIKSTLLKLQMISNSAENIKEIRQLLSNFELIDTSTNYAKDFLKVIIDRNTKDYEALMRWSKVFLMNLSFTSFSGNTTSRALLFPMEKVFESYVAQNIKKIFSGLGWKISAQDKGYYLFNKPEKFALIPDIVITRDNGSKVILDAKWKSLYNNQKQNYGISQSDMYQMYAYSKKYKTSEIWLLYPVNQEMRNIADISFESIDEVSVRIFFINLVDIDQSIEELKDKLKRDK